MAEKTDPSLAGWRQAVGTLGRDLVAFESDATVVMARTGVLVGGSAVTWTEVDRGVGQAWTTYDAMNDLVTEAEAEPDRAPELLGASTVPGRTGPLDPTTAMREAKAAVDAAVAVVARLKTAWDDWATRVAVARRAAETAQDTTALRSIGALADLLATDPFAVTVADVEQVEAAAAAAMSRLSAAQQATARVEIDLGQARTTMATLAADVEGAASELAHAASRIAGVSATAPVPDVDALGQWLDRIAAGAARDPARAARELDDWMAAAQARREELDTSLGPARAGMQRREEGRGLWTALRAKAAGRKVDERPDVAAALKEAQELMWAAPCALDDAEAALARLAAVLETQP